jgi:hypothetical protein
MFFGRMDASEVSIDAILSIEATFIERLRNMQYRRATIRNQISRLRALIRYARKYGYKHPLLALIHQWNVIPLKARTNGLPSIVRYAIDHNIAPSRFNRTDLQKRCETAVAAGKPIEVVARQRKHFSYVIQKLRLVKTFEHFEPERAQLPGFALPVRRMPASLRADVSGLLQWAEREQAAGRLKGRNTYRLRRNLEMLCGYVIHVRGSRTIRRVEQVLSKPMVYDYTVWLNEERGCERTAVINALSAVRSLMLRHKRFAKADLKWWKDILDEIDPVLQSRVDERRRTRTARFEDLAAIPDSMDQELSRAKGRSKIQRALMARDALIMRFLVRAVMMPICVRRATLSNIFKAPVPRDDPSFAVPDWAKRLLDDNPDLPLWQFRFSPDETWRGKCVRGLILQELTAPLEKYTKHFRPLLLAGASSESLFVQASGGLPLSASDLTSLVKSVTRRFVGANVGVTPSTIKPSFVDFYLELYPDGYRELADVLWMDYTSVRQAYDPAFKDRSARSSKAT